MGVWKEDNNMGLTRILYGKDKERVRTKREANLDLHSLDVNGFASAYPQKKQAIWEQLRGIEGKE